MYYQVSYWDKSGKSRRRSSMIHTNNADALKEMRSKIKAGHTQVVVLTGSKLMKR